MSGSWPSAGSAGEADGKSGAGITTARDTGVGRRIRSSFAGVSAIDAWAFIVPATSFAQVTIGGRLILSEILVLVLLPWLLRAQDRLRAPRWLIALMAAWFASQVITDVVVGSAFTDWVRGWAAIAFTFIDLIAILALAGTARRARIFAAGIAAGFALEYLLNPTIFVLSDPWKFAIAAAIGYLLAAIVSGPATARRPWLAVAAFGAFGLVNAFNGFRSLSGVTLLTATFLAVSRLLARINWTSRPVVARVVVGVGISGASALIVFVGLTSAAANGWLGGAAQTKFEAQAGIDQPSVAPGASPAVGPSPASSPVAPLGVFTGGRAELLPSTQAIRDSPIIGHGSWARGPEYAELQRQRLIELGVPRGNLPGDPTLIPTHSYILGSWVWAGIIGAIFWLAVGLLALWTLVSVYGSGLVISPLVAFVATQLLWSIAFSPYSNTERIYAMFAIVVCLLALRLVGLGQATLEATPRTTTG